MDRHAYCIIAHNDFYCLKTLVSLLDDERNDIIIIQDKKTPPNFFSNITTKKSRLIKPKQFQLIDIRWGDKSLVQAELLAFELALNYGKYSFIHLLSGVDLPLKTQDEIHSYFQSLPPNSNLVGLSQGELNRRDLSEKVNYYHVLTRYYKSSNKLIQFTSKFIHFVTLLIQRSLGIKRKWSPLKPFKGSNWVTISSDFAQYLVDNKDFILKRFKGVFCADEIYKQTLIMNSPFRNTLVDTTSDNAGFTRLIDWEKGNPYIWQVHDYLQLIHSDALFARKFSSSVDKDIIDKIYNYIVQKTFSQSSLNTKEI